MSVVNASVLCQDILRRKTPMRTFIIALAKQLVRRPISLTGEWAGTLSLQTPARTFRTTRRRCVLCALNKKGTRTEKICNVCQGASVLPKLLNV